MIFIINENDSRNGWDFREENNFNYRGCQKTQVLCPCALFENDNSFSSNLLPLHNIKVFITVRSEISVCCKRRVQFALRKIYNLLVYCNSTHFEYDNTLWLIANWLHLTSWARIARKRVNLAENVSLSGWSIKVSLKISGHAKQNIKILNSEQ